MEGFFEKFAISGFTIRIILSEVMKSDNLSLETQNKLKNQHKWLN
jgi:hypothetical protein